MKKILFPTLLLTMTLCFAACGGSEDAATPTQADSEVAAVDESTDTAATDTAETDTAETDTAETDTAAADADYNQLLTFVEGLSTHGAMID